MKKLIIIGIFVFMVTGILIAQRRSSLHRIPSPTKIEGWLNTNGDIWPVMNSKWDLGKPAYWWERAYQETLETRLILVWSPDSTDTTTITPTSYTSPSGRFDSLFTNFITSRDSTEIKIVDNMIFDSTTTSYDTTWWIDGIGGADSSYQIQDGTQHRFGTDNKFWFLAEGSNVAAFDATTSTFYNIVTTLGETNLGNAVTDTVTCSGVVVDSAEHNFLDNVWFRNGDTLFFVNGADTSWMTNDDLYFKLGGDINIRLANATTCDELVAFAKNIQVNGDAILGNASTDKVAILGDTISFITGVCSTYWYQTADSSILKSNKPMRLGSGSIILSDDSVRITDVYYASGGGVTFGEIGVYNNVGQTAIAGAGTKVQYDSFNTDGVSNNITPDEANEQLTIDHAGIYQVTLSIHASGVAGGAVLFSFDIYKNNGGTHLTNLHAHRNFAAGVSDIASISISGLVSLSASDDLELWVTNETNTDNITLNDVTLSVIQVGN